MCEQNIKPESSDSVGQPTEITICMACRELNLTESTQFNNCKKCSQVYCLHYASIIDPAYCTACLHDVTVKEETIVKTQEHYNAETDKTYTRTRKARKLSLGGMHWLFQARKIESLTELELELGIEYHRDILGKMLYERDERFQARIHRNHGKGLPLRFNVGSVTESTSETIEVKKTKIKSAVKADPMKAMMDAMKILQSSGLTPEMIAKMARGGK